MKIKTKRQKFGNGELDTDLMLQLNNNTLQIISPRYSRGYKWYVSDSFGKTYDTITAAKQHTMKLALEGYFGEIIQSWAKGEKQ